MNSKNKTSLMLTIGFLIILVFSVGNSISKDIQLETARYLISELEKENESQEREINRLILRKDDLKEEIKVLESENCMVITE